MEQSKQPTLMTGMHSTFWKLVATAQEKAMEGDPASALHAVREARATTEESTGEFRQRRMEMLDALTRMICDCHAPTPNEVRTEHPAPHSTMENTSNRPFSPMPGQRLLVSGIGRSGTTLIYQQLAKLLLYDSRKVNFRYEPYLWNIHEPAVDGNPFDMSQFHYFGMLAHARSPLFLGGSHPDHDPFLDHLFNDPWDGDSALWPDNHLTKVIRGSGRLRSHLKRYPDLKVVACLRNPLDTINSSMGMFSFFGEEFHADDRLRFRAELAARGEDVSELSRPDLSIQWFARWWRAFTEEMLSVAEDHPGNVMLFCYEAFQKSPNEMLESLMAFAGTRNLGMFAGLDRSAGPTIRSTSLTQHDIRVLKPHVDYYTDVVLKPCLGAQDAVTRTEKTVTKYLEGRFTFPIAGADPGRNCPIRLRGIILSQESVPFVSLIRRPSHEISMDDLIARHHPADRSLLRRPHEQSDALRKGKRFGAVITCHNNRNTITDAILSCLNQTLPFDEIVVVNDKSTDGSEEFLNELEKRYSCLTVLNLPSNLGPSAARDLGIRKLTTDFFTQLDGDDLFWPTKNAGEAAAIAGDEGVVAFSDVLLVENGNDFIQSTHAYDGLNGTQALHALLARTPQVPRDMTLSRQIYFQAGGYDITRHLYEDWDFKLRLATKATTWIRADNLAGTIYNRIHPGLSGVPDEQHARALSQIFLSALHHMNEIPSDQLLPSFASAMGRFKDSEPAIGSRAVLHACVAGTLDPHHVAQLVSRRDMCAMDDASYATALEAIAAQSIHTGIQP